MGLRLVAQLKGGLQGGGNVQDRPGSVGTRTRTTPLSAAFSKQAIQPSKPLTAPSIELSALSAAVASR
ncbi:MAG: hypothetical protein ACLSTO_01870 [Bilophila wadsworthia]